MKSTFSRFSMILPALLLAIGFGQLARAQTGPKPTAVFQCTPKSVSYGGGSQQVANPIAFALERAGPGSTVYLGAGTYRPFSIGVNTRSANNARTSGGQRGRPITIEGRGKVMIHSGSAGDTILVSQSIRNGHFLFKNITIEPGYRAAVMFARGGVHEGFRFWDCNIVGRYNHAKKSGKASRWGVWGSQLKDFEFKGTRSPAEVNFLRDEHGFYLQNARGDLTIENVKARHLGRTFCQITARSSEGPPGVGTIVIRNCEVWDIGLAPGDGYKGGFAFTFGGRHTGTIRLEDNTYYCGFNPKLKHLKRAGSLYGTGALVMIDGGEGMNSALVLRGNKFLFAADSGDRAVVSIGGCRDVQITGRNEFRAGAYGIALDLDPLSAETRGGMLSKPNRRVRLSPTTTTRGQVRIAGKIARKADLARFNR